MSTLLSNERGVTNRYGDILERAVRACDPSLSVRKNWVLRRLAPDSRKIEIAIQVNGKLRSRIFASPDAADADLQAMALADEKVTEYTNGKEVAKVVVVPKRLVNIVVRG